MSIKGIQKLVYKRKSPTNGSAMEVKQKKKGKYNNNKTKTNRTKEKE